MKYPCYLIEDLLPLYYDGICSAESNEDIKKHLSECPDCTEKYKMLCESEDLISLPTNREYEMQKAASFHSVRKRITRKQIIITLTCFIILISLFMTFWYIMASTVKTVEFHDNISVSMVDGNLIGRLEGNRVCDFYLKRVIVQDGTEETHYIFYNVSATEWDNLVTNKDIFSEYTLCYSDKSADEIDYVYYFTGDYENIENMNRKELKEIIDKSVLLWSKSGIDNDNRGQIILNP